MECNREEAIRAKEIAEKRMQIKDFVGARKIIIKAQQLYPDLENVSQMLTVCEVHCAAEIKLFGSETDWYGVLQVEQTADEASIKKQYRKLALQLHPDKNKFAGAEAAFKVIGEAQGVLSDKGKRSLHDLKRRGPMRTAAPKPPPYQKNRNFYVRKQPEVQNNFVNTTGLNPHQKEQQQQQQQQTHPVSSNGQPTFWTHCHNCGVRYQYFLNILNRSITCQNCQKPFTAYDINAQGAKAGANRNPCAFSQPKNVPSQGAHKVGLESTVGNPPSTMGSQGNCGSGATATMPFSKTESTSEVGRGSRNQGKEDGRVDLEAKNQDQKVPKFEAEKPSENMSRKRRKLEDESSKSCDTSSDTDTEEVVIEKDGLSAGQNSRFTSGRYPRRSTRQKQQVAYNEDINDDDDFTSPPKRSRGSGPSNVTGEKIKEPSSSGEASKTDKPADLASVFEEKKKEGEQKGRDTLEQSLPNVKDKVEECKANGKAADKERSKINGDSDLDSSSKTVPDSELLDYPDPDFNDFDEDRTEDHFAVDQIWAIYDSAYGMPRFYARIKKVCLPGFKLQITWLEPNPDDKDEIAWLDAELPVACGKFKLGDSEYTEDHLMFSHLASWEKGSRRGLYKIYPRKGETWALFKNWNIKWNSNADNHRQHEFEFVEVLSDYSESTGINVVYLGKMKGFVSLFWQTVKKGMLSFQIPPNELFRFSHRIPSIRMTGMEREDVPEGSFELDPASLPTDIKEFTHLEGMKVDFKSMDADVNGSSPVYPREKVEPKTRSGRSTMLKKSADPDDKNALERSNLKSGNGYLSESNGSHKSSASACQADVKERPSDVEGTNSDCMIEEPCLSPASSPEDYVIPETEFYNFEADKSQERFQLGQIWALYSEEDCLPKYYAVIKKIESSPHFKLHITWFEPCPLPKDVIRWFNKDMPISCGMFRIGKSELFEIGSFSHQLKAESTGKNRYYIYPRKGEVWALYKNWSAKWKSSDLKNCKYDVVEVLQDNGSWTEVLILEQIEGFNSVFKAQSKAGSAVTIQIPRVDMLRFSHQIPAFQLTKEKDGSLRGCWELDPGSLPSHYFRAN